MFSLFKRKSAPVTEATFKSRVEGFWGWYAEQAARFFQVIESGQCSQLASEISAKVEELGSGFAWVFGPGPEAGKGHSLTLSGEGNAHLQFLTRYWLSQAPQLPGWTFYAARQPGSIRGKRIEIGGRKFDPLEFWLSPAVDREAEKVDIHAWHPLFDVMEERERWTVLFLFLDEVLGEHGTQMWIGEIKHSPERLADSIPLEELPEFFRRIEAETGWKKFPPGEAYVAYHLPEPSDRFRRGGAVVGTTTHPQLVNEYLGAEGEMEDPLRGLGADYVFVEFESGFLPQGQESEKRGEVEDALEAALEAGASGRVLGGAWGPTHGYIDLLLFDGPASLEIVRGVLRAKSLPAGTAIHYFAKEKRGHRIML